MISKTIAVTVVAICGAGLLAAAQQPVDSSLEIRIERLQARIAQTESVRAVKRLQYAYGHYVEFGLWNDFADLFTENAVTNYQQGAQGSAGVRKLFFEQVGQGKLGLADGRIYPHILFQPVITPAPDGRTAKGRWRILAMLGGAGGSATWYSGVYENEYILQDGVWKISLLRSEPRATASYTAAGWRDSGIRIPPHYTPVSAANVPDVRPSAAKDETPSFASLAERVNRLAHRAELLNDHAEVTNLQDTYGYAFDRKLWDQVAELFAGDGTLELGLQGIYAGKASIRRGLNRFGPQGLGEGERHDHVYLQTLVSVAPDGRTAKARGVELIMSSSNGGELEEGVFENTFVKQEGKWKIQSVRFYPRMIVDASAGWARSAKPAPGASKEFPPDRPPTSDYGIFPKFSVAPFHFDNPVTGKPPQYPEGVLISTKPAAVTAVPPTVPEIRDVKELEVRLAEVEGRMARAEAYDAAENLLGAYGYDRDASPASPEDGTIFASQILQPVIDVAPDGKSAMVRARRLDLGGTSGGAGYWAAGSLEGQILMEQSGWKLRTTLSSTVWTAPYPGGWARTSERK